jgi:hypothetical protein
MRYFLRLLGHITLGIVVVIVASSATSMESTASVSDERTGESIVVRDGKIAWVGPTVSMPAQPHAPIIDPRTHRVPGANLLGFGRLSPVLTWLPRYNKPSLKPARASPGCIV